MLITHLNNRKPYCFSQKVHIPETTVDLFLAAARGARAYAQPPRESDDEDPPNPAQPEFSIGAIIEEKGADYVRSAIHLTWNEFQELFEIAESSLKQKGRGRRRKLDRIDRFFIVMVYLTSRCTITKVAMSLNVSKSFVERTLQETLNNIQVPLEQFFPVNQANIQYELTFENHSGAFCIVDASPSPSGIRQGIKPNITQENIRGTV
jgi:hypothetical protein